VSKLALLKQGKSPEKKEDRETLNCLKSAINKQRLILQHSTTAGKAKTA
jgi:hypothetical protein